MLNKKQKISIPIHRFTFLNNLFYTIWLHFFTCVSLWDAWIAYLDILHDKDRLDTVEVLLWCYHTLSIHVVSEFFCDDMTSHNYHILLQPLAHNYGLGELVR